MKKLTSLLACGALASRWLPARTASLPPLQLLLLHPVPKAKEPH
ncbi:hypothetical protein [Allobaculum sp. Allo2]|nr:hypothetical protein [Allobaculum sp. Allo2]